MGALIPRRAGGRTDLDVDPDSLIWATYARESLDPDDEAEQVANQNADLRQYVADAGGTLGRQFTENDTSAFKKRRVRLDDGTYAYRVVRPVWDAMMTDLRRGTYNALALPKMDRGMRDPRDLEDLIDLVEHYGVLVVGITGFLDLTTDAGIAMARNEVNQRNLESRNISRRMINGKRHAALKGRNSGGANRPFGWNADKTTLNETEAALIREAARRIAESVKPITIVKDWQERGEPSVTGRGWRTQTLVNILTNPRLCGYKTYKGEVLKQADGSPVIGVWEPILTPAEFEALSAYLTQRPRSNVRNGRGRTTKYLLSPFVRCGKCQAKLTAGLRPGPKGTKIYFYHCRAKSEGGCGGCSRNGADVDRYITELVIQDHERRSFRKIEDLPPWNRESELGALRQQIAELTEEYKKRRISGGRYFALLEDLETEERKLVNERKRHEAQRQSQRAAVADLRARWSDPSFTLEQRQAAVAESLIAVVINPVGLGSAFFDPSKIEPIWRDEAD